jgi:hypothetical protein
MEIGGLLFFGPFGMAAPNGTQRKDLQSYYSVSLPIAGQIGADTKLY